MHVLAFWLGLHIRSLQQSSDDEPAQPNVLSCTHCTPQEQEDSMKASL